MYILLVGVGVDEGFPLRVLISETEPEVFWRARMTEGLTVQP